MKIFQPYRRALSGFFIFLMLCCTFSCYSRRYLQKTNLSKIKFENLEFIVLDAAAPETNAWVLSNVTAGDSTLTARFDRASPAFAKTIASLRGNRDMAENQNKVLVYINSPTAKWYADGFEGQLDFAAITKIEVFEPDAGKVVAVVLGSIVGFVAFAYIILLISCACPYVYIDTATGPLLAGELYAGAAYPQLERHDWLPLPDLQVQNGQYSVTLANKLFENQHTNLLELQVLDAAPGARPLFDKYGQLHTISAPQMPRRAINVSGQNVRDQILREDEIIFRGDQHNQHPDATEQLNLSFDKPAGAQQAKLVIRAKNNIWLDYTYHEFQNQLGVYGPKIRQKYLKKTAAENLAWLERQKIPLAVWLETQPGHWEKADYFNVAGPMAFKTDVLSLNLSQVQGDVVHLRLEFGFNFWEIDYVALDFTAELPVTLQRLSPRTAITESGADVAAALEKDDARYYDQPNIGEAARISFEAPPLEPGSSRSLILHAKGHYEIQYQPVSGRPGYFQLKKWERENALPRLARQRWFETQKLTVTTE